jgi:hypothetical protein
MEMSNTSLTDLVISSLTLWISKKIQVTCVVGIGDKQVPNLEPDGLPAVGSMLNQGDPLYWLDSYAFFPFQSNTIKLYNIT